MEPAWVRFRSMSMVEAQIWVWVLGPIWTEEAGAGLRHNWDARTPALSVGGVAISALCVLYGRVSTTLTMRPTKPIMTVAMRPNVAHRACTVDCWK